MTSKHFKAFVCAAAKNDTEGGWGGGWGRWYQDQFIYFCEWSIDPNYLVMKMNVQGSANKSQMFLFLTSASNSNKILQIWVRALY